MEGWVFVFARAFKSKWESKGQGRRRRRERGVYISKLKQAVYVLRDMLALKRKLKFRMKCYIIKGSLMLSCWSTRTQTITYTNESGWVHLKENLVLDLRGTNIRLILISGV